MTSPVRPIARRLCLACWEPDRSVKVVEAGIAVTVCACGAVERRPAEPWERSDTLTVSRPRLGARLQGFTLP